MYMRKYGCTYACSWAVYVHKLNIYIYVYQHVQKDNLHMYIYMILSLPQPLTPPPDVQAHCDLTAHCGNHWGQLCVFVRTHIYVYTSRCTYVRIHPFPGS